MNIERAACPDCNSFDVSQKDDPHRPQWYCWDCGIRFDHAKYRPEVVE